MREVADGEALELSVLIATRDRVRLLEQTLRHLERQHLPGVRWELVVVDNGSTDSTPAALASAGASLPLVAVREPVAGKNRALNRALAVARGRLLVFTDDDMGLPPNWLAELSAAAQRWPEHAIFCGPIIPAYPPEAPAWLREHPYAGPAYARFQPAVPEGPLPDSHLPFGGNYAVRAAVMHGRQFCPQLGPQGESFPLGDETEMLRRLREAGARIVYVPSAPAKHQIQKHQLEMAWLFKRAFCIGRGTARLQARRQPPGAAKAGLLILLSWARHALSAFAHERRRFETGARLHYLRGMRHEQRIMAAEAQARPTPGK